MKSIGELGCFDVWSRPGGEPQRWPVQFEKNKNDPRQNPNLFFQRVPVYASHAPPTILASGLAAGGSDRGGGVLGTGFGVLPDALQSRAAVMSNLAALSAQNFADSIRGVPGSIPPSTPLSGQTVTAGAR